MARFKNTNSFHLGIQQSERNGDSRHGIRVHRQSKYERSSRTIETGEVTEIRGEQRKLLDVIREYPEQVEHFNEGTRKTIRVTLTVKNNCPKSRDRLAYLLDQLDYGIMSMDVVSVNGEGRFPFSIAYSIKGFDCFIETLITHLGKWLMSWTQEDIAIPSMAKPSDVLPRYRKVVSHSKPALPRTSHELPENPAVKPADAAHLVEYAMAHA